jgi:hypothetical protein
MSLETNIKGNLRDYRISARSLQDKHGFSKPLQGSAAIICVLCLD